MDKLRGATADEGKLSRPLLYAPQVTVYPKAVRGPARTFKWAVLVFCLSAYYLLPWLRWDRGPGRVSQAVLFDLPDRRFYFFNAEFWPQDIYFLAGGLILSAVALFLVTSLAGRVWCGYACPQTVWTDLFMWVERRIEGDRNEHMRRDKGPLTFDKVWRKAVKHTIWLAIAFWTGGAWIMYFVDAPTLTMQFWTGAGRHRGLYLHLPVHLHHLSPGRLGARAGVHLHVPLAALPGLDARRAKPDRHLPGLARRAARASQDRRRQTR